MESEHHTWMVENKFRIHLKLNSWKIKKWKKRRTEWGKKRSKRERERVFVCRSDKVRWYPAGPYGLMLRNGCVSDLCTLHASRSLRGSLTLVSGHTWFCWPKSSHGVRKPLTPRIRATRWASASAKLCSSVFKSTENNIKVRDNVCLSVSALCCFGSIEEHTACVNL